MDSQSRVYLWKHTCGPGILLLTNQVKMAGSRSITSQVKLAES